jgi:UDP-hydrolysing UDP-N-acetyl-D-glucosamine 2-epimerase
MVSGTHLSPEFGLTVHGLEEGGFPPADRIEMLVSSDTPEGTGLSMGLGLQGFARSFARSRPDLLVVLGDRFEMFCAALAALPFRIPVAHIHGGEVTEGAMDDNLRHAMTKLSHLHFVSTADHGRRLERMGEEPWRITVAGALGLDNLEGLRLLSRGELEKRIGMEFAADPVLVTFHPATLDEEDPGFQTEELLAVLAGCERPLIFSRPNADPRSRLILEKIRAFASGRSNVKVAETLGTDVYFSLMATAAAMVGNSSSGLIEAPSFGLPVVNVGNRQRGRTRGANVIDADPRRESVAHALRRALDPAFRRSLKGAVNPYRPKPSASACIVGVLAEIVWNQRLIHKKFYEPGPEQ